MTCRSSRLGVPFAVLACALAGVSSASAATITVNSTADAGSGPSGTCTLREAIAAVDSPGSVGGECAAAAFGPNTIVLGAHSYQLNLATAGELKIATQVDGLTIQGAGEGATTIDATGLGARVFEIAQGASAAFSDLTISGGTAPAGTAGTAGVAGDAGAGLAGGNGGAILNAGGLTLTNVAITGSHAGSGGAGGSCCTQPLNPAGLGGAGGAGGSGGGIYNTGQLALTGVTLSGDTAGAGGNGGGGGQSSAFPVVASAPGGAGGPGGNGGGLANAGGSVTISGATVNGDTAGVGGAGGPGGAADAATAPQSTSAAPAAAAADPATTSAAASTAPTVSPSTGPGGAGGAGGQGGDGGGIWSAGSPIQIANLTLASNTSGAGGAGGAGSAGQTGGAGGAGGASGSGGGITASGAPGATYGIGADLENATIAGNSLGAVGRAGAAGTGAAPGAAGAAGAAGTGGGVDGAAAEGIALKNSLVTRNAGGNCSPGTVADDGENLASGDSTCPAGFSAEDPMLEALSDNGGAVQTIALSSGSAALNAIPAGTACPTTDARGVKRPSGSGCDIGAYEAAPPVLVEGAGAAISATQAKLPATITANAGSATVTLQYGLTDKYGHTVKLPAATGVVAASMPATLGGLTPGATYHYRITVVAPDGTATGTDKTVSMTTFPYISALKVTPKAGTITYRDSIRARTTLVLARPVTGRSSGKKCMAAKPGAKGRKCTLFKTVHRTVRTDTAGANKVTLPGGRLAKGRYRLTVTSKAGTHAGTPRTKTFTVK